MLKSSRIARVACALVLLGYSCAAIGATSGNTHLVRVKDVASIEGIRENQLIGYGIVVGLRNTGDSSQTVFPVQTLVSALERMGVNLRGSAASSLRVQNMAAVFVAATLPPLLSQERSSTSRPLRREMHAV